MEPQLLSSRVVFVKDPTALPNGVAHCEAIDALAKNNKVVILLSHGNKYILPKDWTPPANVSMFEYDLDLLSITHVVGVIRDLLRDHGIEIHSRHLDNDDPMPMILAGACLTVGPNTKIVFVNKPDQYLNIKQTQDPIVETETDWDLS